MTKFLALLAVIQQAAQAAAQLDPSIAADAGAASALISATELLLPHIQTQLGLATSALATSTATSASASTSASTSATNANASVQQAPGIFGPLGAGSHAPVVPITAKK